MGSWKNFSKIQHDTIIGVGSENEKHQGLVSELKNILKNFVRMGVAFSYESLKIESVDSNRRVSNVFTYSNAQTTAGSGAIDNSPILSVVF